MPPFHGQPLHKDYWLNELSQHHIPGVGCSVISPTSEVSTKLSIDATGVKQSKHQKEIESGYRNKWYCPTVSDEDANTAIPTSVNMSIGDNAILVNGIKYIKAESQSYQKSADADPEASAHDISHDEDETTDIQSEQHEDEVEYCGDYNDQDKTCSHVGDWDERWNDHGHQEQALAEGDDAYSNAGVQDAVSTGHGGDDNDDEYHDEGTLENPIQEPRYVVHMPMTHPSLTVAVSSMKSWSESWLASIGFMSTKFLNQQFRPYLTLDTSPSRWKTWNMASASCSKASQMSHLERSWNACMQATVQVMAQQ